MSHDTLFLPRQITDAPYGHILTNTAVWSPDGEWIVYDIRSDPTGSVFDGRRIERVHIASGRVEVLYESQRGACCGVATYHPTAEQVVFILGPENPTPDWQYSPCHRQGVLLDTNRPQKIRNLDARDLTPPFTPGALRGGTHLHVFSHDGQFVSFSYDDHLLTELGESPNADRNQRNVGVSLIGKSVTVPETHPRNHNGTTFSVLITKTVNYPTPGSDQICRAYEDAWIDDRRITFLGDVVSAKGEIVTELFVVDLPDDVTINANEALAGTATCRPAPPAGTVQRRLTFTTNRKHPGIQGPRHWPRSSRDGSRIAFLMRDDHSHVQLWTIASAGGAPRQVTQLLPNISSAFSWHPNGENVAAIADGMVWVVNTTTEIACRLTPAPEKNFWPRAEACIFSPDGKHIAYVQPVNRGDATYNQIFVVQAGLS
jgi:hypothetical protein